VNDDQMPGLVPFDHATATPARRYDYLHGGKDNFEADRNSAAELAKIFPDAAVAAAENRRFIRRVVKHLSGELGVRQFLDIGCGIPEGPSVFELAGAGARVVSVDNDEHVAVHGRAFLGDGPNNGDARARFVLGDLRWPDTFLTHADLTGTLDLTKPVAVVIGAVLHFIPAGQDPYGAVRTVMDTMPPGSYLAVSVGTGDFMTTEQLAAFAALPESVHGHLVSRTKTEIARFFDGLTLQDPGLVPTADWHRPTPDYEQVTAAQCAAYAALAVKP
jgi:hypothetical protein